MRIGFVGAGRMGFTMGKHLVDYSRTEGSVSDISVVGYYSRTKKSAVEAAGFTGTGYFDTLSELIQECDTVFITTPDAVICHVIKEISDILAHRDKEMILIHTSGALSSQVFFGMGSHVYGYSIHPVYAVSSRTESYVNFKDSFITIEGNERYLYMLCGLFEAMGHKVKAIAPENKVKYHAAAVFSSNLVIGLYHMAKRLLLECDFSPAEADAALMPLFMGNAKSLSEKGCMDALTGPVARCDKETVRGHLDTLSKDEREVYKLLSKELVEIARGKAMMEMDNENNKSTDIEKIKDKYKTLLEILEK